MVICWILLCLGNVSKFFGIRHGSNWLELTFTGFQAGIDTYVVRIHPRVCPLVSCKMALYPWDEGLAEIEMLSTKVFLNLLSFFAVFFLLQLSMRWICQHDICSMKWFWDAKAHSHVVHNLPGPSSSLTPGCTFVTEGLDLFESRPWKYCRDASKLPDHSCDESSCLVDSEERFLGRD